MKNKFKKILKLLKNVWYIYYLKNIILTKRERLRSEKWKIWEQYDPKSCGINKRWYEIGASLNVQSAEFMPLFYAWIAVYL